MSTKVDPRTVRVNTRKKHVYKSVSKSKDYCQPAMAVNISEVTIQYSWILLLTTVITDCMYQPTGQKHFSYLTREC